MTAERWERIKAVFDSALKVMPENRPSFLANACMGDEGLRAEVSRLLVEFEKTETFLGQPVACLSYSLPPGKLVAGRYRVVQLLGRGGMGEVYQVMDELLNEPVALKTLRPDLCYDESLLRRFQMEIQLARKVTHPSVCRVFEVGVHRFNDTNRPPLHFFTMQLLKGETLALRIHRAGRLSAGEAFPLVVQMAEGLQAAHAEGIIHRDFKSGNVILAKSRALITDFGLAALDPGLAPTDSEHSVPAEARIAGTVASGTVAYMSPEQMSGGPVTTASDIYSFGIVLFEMATGRLPFEDRHIIQSAMQRARGQIPPVRILSPDIDPRWESAIRRCLEIEPSRRFQSASELAALFRDAEWRLPRLYWTRRQWGLWATVSTVPVAASGWYWFRSRRPYKPKPEALVWYQRGVDGVRAATYEAARRALEKAVDTDARYAPAYAFLALTYSDLDMSERAQETMLKAVSLAQDERLNEQDNLRVKALQYVISRDFARAQPLFEQLQSAASGREKAGAYVDLAWLALKREDNPGMIPPLEQALELDPNLAGAKLRLAIAMDRQGKKDAAQKFFAEAESLFTASSDYEGVGETLLQRAISLGRANRTPEAEALINRAIPLASSTGDLYHAIRLQLALALAYRNQGETAKSREIAERAVKIAVDNRMDTPAAIGLVDLGAAYQLRSEPEPAKRHFLQGLEFANRGRALFTQARARFSLGALSLQYGQPLEVSKYVQPALVFFRSTGYRREAMQSLLVLGGAQESLAQFEDAEKTLRDAIQVAEQIHDAENTALAHSFLGSVWEKTGRWPESIAEKNQALSIFGEMRGGYRAANTLAERGRLWARMGRFPQASVDLAQARARLEKLEGKQAQLRVRLALGEAEIAYYRTHWAQALRWAREAGALDGGADENSEAEVLTGLAMLRTGSIQEGLAACDRATRQSQEKSQPYLAAWGRLLLAQALRENGSMKEAAAEAQEALAFFAPRHIWEAAWRCQKILAEDDAARAALAELKRSWSEDMVRPYLERPDLKKLALS
jgi:tetratricopeptide (TPR) repeat protein